MSAFLSLSQAANRTGRSRRTLGRMLDAGEIPGAERSENGTWRIPVEALETAGLLDRDVRTIAEDSAPTTWRERALIAEGRLDEVRKNLANVESHLTDVRKTAERVTDLEKQNERLIALLARPAIETTEAMRKRRLFRK